MRKIKWGVLGTAGIAQGQTIPGMLQAKNCALYAIAGRSAEKRELFQERFGFERAYESYEALLADPQVEAVYIPLPNTLHHEWAIRALKAKKHVLCEKPLSISPALEAEMFACARENGVILMEAFAYLHSPIMQALKAEIEGGAIGDVRYLQSEFLTSDYDISNIRMRRATCGGSVYDLGCYCVSQILWLLDKEPERVQAVADYSEEKIDLLTTGILDFAGGVRALFTSGMVLATEQDKRVDHLEIHGSRGMICSNVEFNQCGELRYSVTVGNETVCKSVNARQNYCLEVEQLGRCIAEGEAPHVSEAMSLRIARTLERILKAIQY